MDAALHADNRATLLRGLHTQILVPFVSGGERNVGFARCRLRFSQLGGDFIEFTLPRHRSVNGLVRREVSQAVRADEMPVARDKHFTSA